MSDWEAILASEGLAPIDAPHRPVAQLMPRYGTPITTQGALALMQARAEDRSKAANFWTVVANDKRLSAEGRKVARAAAACEIRGKDYHRRDALLKWWRTGQMTKRMANILLLAYAVDRKTRRAYVIRMVEQGADTRTIAACSGLSMARIAVIRREHLARKIDEGTPRRSVERIANKRVRLASLRRAKIIRMLDNGFTTKHVAAHLELSRKYVAAVYRRETKNREKEKMG